MTSSASPSSEIGGFVVIEDQQSVDLLNKETPTKIFLQIIGKERLERICKMPEISIDVRSIESAETLDDETRIKLLVGMANIQKPDFDPLLDANDDRFGGLLPFRDIKKLEGFASDPLFTSNDKIRSLLEKISVIMRHHFKVVEEKEGDAIFLRDIEMLTSGLAGHELEEGGCFALG